MTTKKEMEKAIKDIYNIATGNKKCEYPLDVIRHIAQTQLIEK